MLVDAPQHFSIYEESSCHPYESRIITFHFLYKQRRYFGSEFFQRVSIWGYPGDGRSGIVSWIVVVRFDKNLRQI
jgi:hypothetical protein